MKIPGWGYMLVGVIISTTSGIIYKTVPKNGAPNMAMALFFFIGMIFIIIGVIKFFFIKIDDTQELNYHRIQQEVNITPIHQHKSNHHNMSDAHINRVEAQMNRIYSQNNQQSTQIGHTQHSSAYAKTHPYYHTTQTVPNQPQNTQTHHQHQTAQHQTNHNITQSMAIITCRKCGNKNPPTANYCHQCGQGLR
jgi:hypothetical protein